MPGKIYLALLILCASSSQKTIVAFADEEIKESSEPDLLVREKRVINHIPGEDVVVEVKNVPYIVHIKYDKQIRCMGSILSRFVVITAASCIGSQISGYHVVSATTRTNRGIRHRVTDVRKHFGNHPNRPSDGIALLTVEPLFRYGAYTNQIELHSEPLLQGMIGTVSGWGFNYRGENRGTDNPKGLRSIQVPIIAHRECVNRYQPHVVISDVDICTHHPQKCCGHNDFGAPLVVDGYLAGVYLWTGITGQHSPNYPDVFALLQHSAYNQWIRTNIQNIDAQFHDSP